MRYRGAGNHNRICNFMGDGLMSVITLDVGEVSIRVDTANMMFIENRSDTASAQIGENALCVAVNKKEVDAFISALERMKIYVSENPND